MLPVYLLPMLPYVQRGNGGTGHESAERPTCHREYVPFAGLYLSYVLIGKSAARALGQAR
jgi:hypothetical protein